jgi:hypothetical protein
MSSTSVRRKAKKIHRCAVDFEGVKVYEEERVIIWKYYTTSRLKEN